MNNDIESTKLAWLAGFLDGEGCIAVYKCSSGHKEKLGKKFTHYQFTVSVTNQEPSNMLKVASIYQEIIGKPFYVKADKSRTDRKYVCYYLRLCTRTDIVKVLSLIQPYLVGKKSQAIALVNMLITHPKNGKFTKAELEIIDILKRMKHETKNIRDGNAEPSIEDLTSPKACVETIDELPKQGKLFG